ncbi:alpha/beta fold hydrolase [Actinoalloteichus caeruleus]|uniref:alpha/beta fold hydrolase n=2 Tax=Actinoalloteichus cyanogriseus TaxID=2893586 RepID=UPI0004C24D51|nr:alpha/beta fold hydrolase [Actinoalloteichus caeruleus]
MAHATTADGARIWYDGDGDGDPVLLLPGQSLDSRMWGPLATDLAARHRVILMDNRGTGRSEDGAETDYSTALFARDALAVLTDQGIDRAHVYGFSMGGRIAQVLATLAPDRIGALVLAATGPGGTEEVPRSEAANEALRTVSTPAGRAALTELFFTPDWVRDHAELVESVTPSNSRRSQRRHFIASTDHRGWDLLPRITAPTLVLHGGDDALTPPENAHRIAGRVPDARVRIFDGARHGVHLEARPAASDTVLDFLAQNPLD